MSIECGYDQTKGGGASALLWWSWNTIQIIYGRYTNGQIAYLAKDVTATGTDLFAEDIQISYVGTSIDEALVYISGRIKATVSEDVNN